MKYKLSIKKQALKSLQRLPLKEIEKINSKILILEKNPRPPSSKKLKGYENIFRIRIGNYRIVYSVYDKLLTVEIIYIAHRKNIYSGF